MSTPFRLKFPAWAAPQEARQATGLSRALSVLFAVAFITAAARMAVLIPGTPVPVTLSDLAVLMVGMTLGPARGAAAVAGYVGLGALGAPVFATGGAGLAWLMGPTGGYLLAYPVAASVAGLGSRGGRSWRVAVPAVLAAQAVVFAGGTLQLALITGTPPWEVVDLAVTPFLPGAALKTALLVAFAAALAARRRTPGPPDGAR